MFEGVATVSSEDSSSEQEEKESYYGEQSSVEHSMRQSDQQHNQERIKNVTVGKL